MSPPPPPPPSTMDNTQDHIDLSIFGLQLFAGVVAVVMSVSPGIPGVDLYSGVCLSIFSVHSSSTRSIVRYMALFLLGAFVWVFAAVSVPMARRHGTPLPAEVVVATGVLVIITWVIDRANGLMPRFFSFVQVCTMFGLWVVSLYSGLVMEAVLASFLLFHRCIEFFLIVRTRWKAFKIAQELGYADACLSTMFAHNISLGDKVTLINNAVNTQSPQ